MDRRWSRITWGGAALIAVAFDMLAGQSIGRPIDTIVVVTLALVLSGRWPWAIGAAIIGGFFRASVSLLPWWMYPLSYLTATIVALAFIRRIVAERSWASYIAASIVGSLMPPLVILTADRIHHWLVPAALHLVAGPWLIMGAMQTVWQPLLLWLWRKLRHGSEFSQLSSSTLRPF